MRKLKDVMADRARAEEDDRDLTSRSDKRNARMSEAESLLSLAGALSELTLKQLELFELSDELLRVLVDAKRISVPGAKARHLKLVRRALQGADVERLQSQVDAILRPTRFNPAPASNATLRKRKGIELAEALISGGDTALFEFCAQHPRVDRTDMRKLVRNVQTATGEARSAHLRKLSLILLVAHDSDASASAAAAASADDEPSEDGAPGPEEPSAE